MREKKSFLNNLRILISKIVLGFLLLNYVFCFPYRIVSTLYLLGIKENYVCFIFVRNKRKPFVSNP